MADILGAMPGCGGAIVVVAAFASGKVSFGAVVATLTATMGDAAISALAALAVVYAPYFLAPGFLNQTPCNRVVSRRSSR